MVADVLRPASHLEACVCASEGAGLIVANLFALEAAHVAEVARQAGRLYRVSLAHPDDGWGLRPYSWWCGGGCQALGVPWAVCQPYPPPRPAPSGLLQAFRMAHPDLYSALSNTTDPQQDEHQQQGDGGGVLVGVWDLEHWLWPIFSDSWLNLRRRWASTTSQHRHRRPPVARV